MKNLILLLSAIFTTVSHAEDFNPGCEKEIKSKMEGCQEIKRLESFNVEKKNYAVAYISCREGDNEIAQFAIVELLQKNLCKILDVDTSFIDYMYGVSEDMKSKSPLAVFESAIKIELNYQLKTKVEKQEVITKYQKLDKIGELTKDQKWVLQFLKKDVQK